VRCDRPFYDSGHTFDYKPFSRGATDLAAANPIQLQKHLKGIDYPVSKQQLIEHAKKHGADENAMEVFEQLPDQEYETPAEVSKAIGQIE
jgi:hypothetical protein